MKKVRFATAAMALALVGCGGGSSGGSGGGTPVANRPPSFTSGSNFSIEETNVPGGPRVIVQLAATDPDGDALTYSIVAGKDGDLFIFSGQDGALAFADEPSFETALDSNGDNIYEVDVRVSDGRLSATQTIQVEVTNSTEGLVVRELATGLGLNGSIEYLPETNEVLVVNEIGEIRRVDVATGVVTYIGQLDIEWDELIADRVIDIAVDDLTYRNGNFFALVRRGDFALNVIYVSANDATIGTAVWGVTTPANPPRPIEASIQMRGNDLMVATGDFGLPDEAQSNSTNGTLIQLRNQGDPTNPVGYFMPQNTVGLGLRSPRLPTTSDLQGWVIDRGERFNELNQADFPISQADANFEWPVRDGFVETGSTTALTGTLIPPRIVQEIGMDGAGRWLDAGNSLQGDGWFGVTVISDSEGNIWTWDAVNDGPLELRNIDFRIASPSPEKAIASIDNGDADVGNAIPIYMLRADGVLLVADLQD